MTTTRKITEGYMPYLGYQTYYRIVSSSRSDSSTSTDSSSVSNSSTSTDSSSVSDNSIRSNSGMNFTKEANKPAEADHVPLLLLHGGPGSTHNYMEVLDDIADTGRLVISYDQLGCGNSYVDGHPELWTAQTWVNELKALRAYLHLDKVHLLGQSWGGMLAIQYLIEEQAAGVQSVILSSTLPASWLWSHEQHRRIHFLSQEDQEAICKAEQTNNYETRECQQATAHFMERYCTGTPGPDAPECLRRPRRLGTESYQYAWGPNEFTPSGTLKDFDYIDRLHEIHTPALIIDGTNDLCSPLIAKTMYDRIPNSRWELFDGARHMCFVEQNKHYEDILRPWLEEHDS